MSLNPKNITSRFKNITLCCSIIILCLLSIAFLTGSIFGISLSSNNDNVSALSYSTDQDISFTFSPKLSISLSDTNLAIDTLVPGHTSTSNAITITVASNTPYGYSLYADAGSNDTESIYYNTSDLIRNDSTVSNTFTSIATNASLSTLTTDNTWGYSTSTDNGTTWSAYNGLPTATSTSGSTSIDNPTLLIDTKAPADSSKSIDFKVAARASTTQASGTYSNIINFYAVGKPEPIYYMQDVTTLKTELANNGDELKATDIRDGKKYWVTKLADDNIWMTQNLDFDIDSTKTYTPADTDIIADWKPVRSTTTDTKWGTSTGDGTTPYSFDPGDCYWTGSVTTDYSQSIYTATSNSGNVHYHIGNYYNWAAAVAMNFASIAADYRDANTSVCPAGWRLPTYDGEKSYDNLFSKQGLVAGISGNIQLSPVYFVYGGSWSSTSYQVGYAGNYWTSISAGDSISSYELSFDRYGVAIHNRTYRRPGSSVRCVMR